MFAFLEGVKKKYDTEASRSPELLLLGHPDSLALGFESLKKQHIEAVRAMKGGRCTEKKRAYLSARRCFSTERFEGLEPSTSCCDSCCAL